MRLIDADRLLSDRAKGTYYHLPNGDTAIPIIDIEHAPTVDAVEVVRCKDCIHQEKFFHEDKRRKDGGHYIYGCELADGYSHVCLDGDYCSRGKRRTE